MEPMALQAQQEQRVLQVQQGQQDRNHHYLLQLHKHLELLRQVQELAHLKMITFTQQQA
jgi:hypothetical protein